MMSSWFKVIKISPCLESIIYGRLAIFLCQNLIAWNKLAVVMGGVS
jgi:hypothetical protein